MENKIINSLFSFGPWTKRGYTKNFYDFDIAYLEKLLRTKGENFWEKLGERKALGIFHAAAQKVPAYQDFLGQHKINHQKIKNIGDFTKVPLTSKENYIQKYPLKSRCWDGRLVDAKIIAMSSGTSGQATLWPRAEFQEFEAAVIHELIYRFIFEINKYKTLLVIGFPMGVYVSGVATLIPSLLTSLKGYPLTVISAGNSKNEVLGVVRQLQKEYEQIILAGHPFFIKDVIETGAEEGIKWGQQRLKMMFCSEEFSEKWRNYVLAKTGAKFNAPNIISTYGSSEMLLMAHETPLSILCRNLMEEKEEFKKGLVDTRPVPNFFQYNPLFRYIESVGEELIFTSGSGIPLIRFNLHDSGHIISFAKVKSLLTKYQNPNIKGLAKFASGGPIWKIPFVALWGRSDYKVIFYAANIYPEHIKRSLGVNPFLSKLTGKFTLRKNYLKNMDEFLEINIELKNGIKPTRTFIPLLQKQIVASLRNQNLEYRDAETRFKEKLHPQIKLWPYQHEKYFKPGLKPRYIV